MKAVSRPAANAARWKRGPRAALGICDVALLQWPAERQRRGELERLGVPRLLIVAPGAAVPLSVDPLEDWIRSPAQQQEAAMRLRQLRARAFARAAPVIDDFDVLRYGDRWLRLSAVEARLMRVLAASLGDGVDRNALMAAGWPGGAGTTRNALDLHILRLRRRIATLGLEIQTLWRHGYSLDAAAPSQGTKGAAHGPAELLGPATDTQPPSGQPHELVAESRRAGNGGR